MDKVLSKPRLGELRIQKKLILNKEYPNNIEVVIGEIEHVYLPDSDIYQAHYIVSFGGDKKIRVIGQDDWHEFLEMLRWLDWDPNDTDVSNLKVDTLEYELEDLE